MCDIVKLCYILLNQATDSKNDKESLKTTKTKGSRQDS
jgi:hypothetical protein